MKWFPIISNKKKIFKQISERSWEFLSSWINSEVFSSRQNAFEVFYCEFSHWICHCRGKSLYIIIFLSFLAERGKPKIFGITPVFLVMKNCSGHLSLTFGRDSHIQRSKNDPIFRGERKKLKLLFRLDGFSKPLPSCIR